MVKSRAVNATIPATTIDTFDGSDYPLSIFVQVGNGSGEFETREALVNVMMEQTHIFVSMLLFTQVQHY